MDLLFISDPEIIYFNRVRTTAELVPDKTINFHFALEVENVAPTVSGNHIAAATGNFQFEIELSDVDITVPNVTNSLTTSKEKPTMKNPSHLDARLLAGSVLSMTGEVKVTLTLVDCSAAHFLCVTLTPGASYTDANTTSASNSHCFNLDTWKVCAPGKLEINHIK